MKTLKFIGDDRTALIKFSGLQKDELELAIFIKFNL